jgi:eukaryotic-like serine/threonine-protein kinase
MTQPENNATETTNETLHWVSAGQSRDLTNAMLGDFQVERLLGRGGMGEVYLARQISLNRPVALKVLRPDLLTKPTYLSRFEAEATAVAKLNHPNIVHIYTLGATEGIRFIAMEYVQGSNLREYIKKKGALDYPLALSIMRQAGVAVGAAGELGLIHRDIKPENLLLTRKGQVKVADFGLCRDLDAERVNITQTGITMGTPAYMSPEQAQGHALDHRSDLYSLGVTFYHMLAGVTPFQADTPIAMALKHVKDKPPSIALHRPDIHPELDRLVLKLMSKSPAARYQSAAEMLKDLGRVREVLHAPTGVQPVADVPGPSSVMTEAFAAPGSSSTTVPARSSPTTSAFRTMFASDKAAPPWPSRRLGGGLVVLALAVGAGLGWLARPDDLLTANAASTGDGELPGLWIDPRWKGIAQATSAETQYLYAQARAPKDMLDAAWLAVPGYFPDSREWTAKAYTQLGRSLLLSHDVDRLRTLADEIEHWKAGQTHEKKLASILHAGVKALEGDLEGVVEDFKVIDPPNLTDPAQLGLCLEVNDQAERVGLAPDSPGSNKLAHDNVRKIREAIVSQLGKTGLRTAQYVNLRFHNE